MEETTPYPAPGSEIDDRLRQLGKAIDSAILSIASGETLRNASDILQKAEADCFDIRWMLRWGEPYSTYLARQREEAR